MKQIEHELHNVIQFCRITKHTGHATIKINLNQGGITTFTKTLGKGDKIIHSETKSLKK